MYVELTSDEINELMGIAIEYFASIFDEEKHKEILRRLDEYNKKLSMPIFIYENPGEYPALVIDEEHVFIDLDENTTIEIRRDRITIRR